MARPTPEEFKQLPFAKRFKQNRENRNIAVTWLALSTLSIPLLMVMGFLHAFVIYIHQKIKKQNFLYYIPYVPLAFMALAIQAITALTRGLLYLASIVMAPLGGLLNWVISFVQAARKVQTLSLSNCKDIAGNMGDLLDRPNSWFSLVNICVHPIDCWNNRKEAKNLAAIKALIPGELKKQQAALNQYLEALYPDAPITEEIGVLKNHMRALFNRSPCLLNTVSFSLSVSEWMIGSKTLKGVSMKTILAALKDVPTDQHRSSQNALDSWLYAFSAQLRYRAKNLKYQNIASHHSLLGSLFHDALSDISPVFHSAEGEVCGPTIDYIFANAARVGYSAIVELLVDFVDINSEILFRTSGVCRVSFLHIAAQSGDIKTVRFLLDKGAHIDAVDFEGKKPIDYLPNGETKETLIAILSSTSVNQQSAQDSVLPPPFITQSPPHATGEAEPNANNVTKNSVVPSL